MKLAHLTSLLLLALSAACSKQDSAPPSQPAASSPATESAPAQPASPAEPPKLDGPTAGDILQKMQDAYAAITNYSAKGKTVSVFDMSRVDLSKMPGMPAGGAKSAEAKAALAAQQSITHDFTLKLGRPGHYQIEWTQTAATVPGMRMGKGAVWSDGASHYLMISPERYSKIQGRDMALAGATGISGGAAQTVPSLFFDLPVSLLKQLQRVARWPDESIENEACYVVEGWVAGSMQMRLWITKNGHLLKQRRHILGNTIQAPPMTDNDIRQSLKAMNQEATPEAIQQMRKTMENAMAMASQLKGSMTETHSDIRINQSLTPADLEFKPPPDAQLAPAPF
ncbi:MAG: hypothetical protein AB1705_25250 [Verrucomicrobiota bacterium]